MGPSQEEIMEAGVWWGVQRAGDNRPGTADHAGSPQGRASESHQRHELSLRDTERDSGAASIGSKD